jgi:hypothetical protein
VSGRGHLWLLLPAAALAALWLAWRGLAAVDFLYPAWYRVLDIHGHVQQFAPENRYKRGFELTTPDERQRLFAEVVDAIHADGRGLAALSYHGPDGRPLDSLFRQPEVQHLKDVARLVGALAPAGWLAVAWVIVHLALVAWRRWPVPPLGRMLAASLGVVLAGLVVVLALGPRRVFYHLHEWVFPPDHPWFFYYQDSLMSTMMKAPDLFGAIAASLVLVARVLYASLLWLARRLSAPQRA